MAINIGSAIAYITLDRSSFKNSLVSAGADLKNFVNGTGEAGGRLKSLGGAMSSVGGTLTKAVTLPIIGAGAACVKLASDFETGMAKINTIAKLTKTEMNDMKKEILKGSSEMAMGAKDFAQATYDAISSGIKKEDAVKFTKDAAKLAKGGFTDVTTATDVLTSTLNAYGKSAKDAKDISNQLIVAQNVGKTTVGEMAQSLGNVIPIASALGVKTSELFSSIAVGTAQGIKSSESITGLKAAMANIVKPSGEAKKAAEALGLQFDANAVKSKGWMGFMQDVKSKLEGSAPAYAKASDEVNKLKAAIAGSGTASAKYKTEIDAEKDKISKLSDEKKGLTKNDKARKAAIDAEIKSMREHMKTMQEQSKTEKQGAGNVKEMKKELKAKEKELKILEGTSKGTLTAFSTMFGSVEGLNSVLAMTSDSGVKLYDESMKEMTEDTNAAEDAFNTMMDTPEEKFKKAKVQLQNLAITIGGQLLPSVVKLLGAFSKVLEMLDKLPGPVKKTIVSFVGMAAIAGPLLKVGGSITKLISTVGKLSKLPGLIKVGVSGVIKTFNLLKNAASIFTMLPALISPPVLIAIAVIAGLGLIIYEVKKHWGGLVESAKWLGHGISDGITKGIPDAVKSITGLGDKIKNAFKKMFGINSPSTVFAGYGGFIIDGLVGGLTSGISKVMKVMGNIAHSIKNTFKKILDIKSPSRVFASYGGFIGEGLLQGLDGQDSAITAKFGGLANKIKGLGNVKPEFQGLNNFALSGSRGGSSGISSNGSSKQFSFSPNITMHVTIADTGSKGTAQLTGELKGMAQSAIKNSMVDEFMSDALRL